MPAAKFPISLSESVVEQIYKRGGDQPGERSSTIADMIERYTMLLAYARSQLRSQFSDAELGLLCDALNGSRYEARTIRLLPMEIEDAISIDRLDQKWQVDGPALVDKLKKLDMLSIFALVDGVEMYWERVGKGEQPNFSEALA